MLAKFKNIDYLHVWIDPIIIIQYQSYMPYKMDLENQTLTQLDDFCAAQEDHTTPSFEILLIVEEMRDIHSKFNSEVRALLEKIKGEYKRLDE